MNIARKKDDSKTQEESIAAGRARGFFSGTQTFLTGTSVALSLVSWAKDWSSGPVSAVCGLSQLVATVAHEYYKYRDNSLKAKSATNSAENEQRHLAMERLLNELQRMLKSVSNTDKLTADTLNNHHAAVRSMMQQRKRRKYYGL